jgi:hypothetical protein
MKRPETIGFILNPKAGKGFTHNAEIARQAARKFKGATIFTGPGELGAAALLDSQGSIEICPCDPIPGRQQTITLAGALAGRQVDLLVVVGGDGTLSDVACGLVDMRQAPPVLGIGVGSTNVGPLITCQAWEIDRLDPGQLETTVLPAVLVKDRGALLGIGFNDCVLGFSVVGTLDGQIRNVDARAKMDGLNLSGEPKPIGTLQTLVQRITPQQIVEIARGAWVGCVVIGFAEAGFFGKAITGGVCLASLTHTPAGCLVADTPLVQVEITRDQLLAFPALRSQYISFDENMSIRVAGVMDGTAVCADGTPLKILSPQDQVEFFVQPAAIRAVRLRTYP